MGGGAEDAGAAAQGIAATEAVGDHGDAHAGGGEGAQQVGVQGVLDLGRVARRRRVAAEEGERLLAVDQEDVEAGEQRGAGGEPLVDARAARVPGDAHAGGAGGGKQRRVDARRGGAEAGDVQPSRGGEAGEIEAIGLEPLGGAAEDEHGAVPLVGGEDHRVGSGAALDLGEQGEVDAVAAQAIADARGAVVVAERGEDGHLQALAGEADRGVGGAAAGHEEDVADVDLRAVGDGEKLGGLLGAAHADDARGVGLDEHVLGGAAHGDDVEHGGN